MAFNYCLFVYNLPLILCTAATQSDKRYQYRCRVLRFSLSTKLQMPTDYYGLRNFKGMALP